MNLNVYKVIEHTLTGILLEHMVSSCLTLYKEIYNDTRICTKVKFSFEYAVNSIHPRFEVRSKYSNEKMRFAKP